MSPHPTIQTPGRLFAASLAALLVLSLWAAQARGQTGMAYEVRFKGLESYPEGLTELLEGSSLLISLQEETPESRAALNRRIESDIERFKTALASEGFYEPRIQTRVEQGDPAVVTITVDPGVIYLLAAYEITGPGDPRALQPFREDLSRLGLHIGMQAEGDVIQDAQAKVIRHLKRNGYPFATVLDRRVTVNHDTTTLAVQLSVDSGPFATFGPVSFEGLEDVEAAHPERLVTWREGEPYDESKLLESERVLSRTNLFRTIALEPAERLSPDGSVAIKATVEERDHRSIAFGLRYDSSTGPGGLARWTHRNLLGRGELLTLEAEASPVDQRLESAFQKPWFLDRKQTLLADFLLRRQDNDAFQEESATTFAGVKRTLFDNDHWTGTAGVELSLLRINDEKTEERTLFELIGAPLSLEHDSRDNRLHPTEGLHAKLETTPYVGLGENALGFVSSTAMAASYLSLHDADRLILAGRGKVGTILGASSSEIPASKRFYAGGGGSVRGYEFQSVGPLAADDDPLGGTFLAEVSLELRARITETIGIVPFIDGGTVIDQAYPNFSEDFLWAGGLGLRYHTPIGPLRLDVAVPINGRDRDDSFQFYISLGQAF